MLVTPSALFSDPSAPQTTIESYAVCPGSIVISALTVIEFTDISSISLRIDYNPTFIDFDTAININPSLTGLIVNKVNVSPTLSKILIAWANFAPVTITDGDNILELVFNYIFGDAILSFNNQSNGGSDCEYADPDGNPLIDTPTGSYYFNGHITQGSAQGGSISGSKTITYGQSTGNLLLTGYTGEVLTWQKKYNTGDYSNISGTAGSPNYSEIPDYTGIWNYRALVSFDTCSQDYSSPALITVTMPSGMCRTWTGVASNDWIHPSNWNPGGVPENMDNIIIPSDVTTMPIIKNNGMSCSSLAISTGAILTILTGSSLQVTFSFGQSKTINQTVGNVAPIYKAVTYATITNIPGELSKCWITQNLGADQQATAVDDATKESAGWYWQFNQMQGFEHDGTIQSPNTTWISNINEDSDRIAANDPCFLELSSKWGLPTSTEWTNVDTNGGWSSWNDPWNSDLKLHAAGNLISNNGGLYNIGRSCTYWSNSQSGNSYGWNLFFYNNTCGMNSYGNKARALSIRCIHDFKRPD